MRLRYGKRQIASLLLPLLAVALIAASAAFGAYALILMLLALLLLSVLRNGMLSFSTALFISCIVFGGVDDFFVIKADRPCGSRDTDDGRAVRRLP